MSDEAVEYLRALGRAGDGPHDIALAALYLSGLDHPGRPLGPYRAHLDEIAKIARPTLEMAGGVREGAHALSGILAGRYGYDGDRKSYDDPMNGDLVSVIDRKRGLPVALGILYIHAARAGGLRAMGLNTPAHFLVRLEKQDRDMIVDPFHGGLVRDREEMSLPGGAAAAEASLAEPVSDTDVLLRLQNNLKLRALQAGLRARATEIARRMVMIAPRRPELWLDLARLEEIAGTLGAARKAYEACLDIARAGEALHNEAALALAGLKRKLN